MNGECCGGSATATSRTWTSRRPAATCTSRAFDPRHKIGNAGSPRAKTKKEVVNLALQYYADKQERAARIVRHFERARHWGAVADAESRHRAEKEAR